MDQTNKPSNPLDDLSKIRINQDFNDGVGVKKAILTIPVRKPNKQDFVRVHPSTDMRISPVAMIDLKEEREVYLVSQEIASQLPGEVQPKLLVTAINRQGVVFLWPINIDLADGSFRRNNWNETAHTAANLAQKSWVKMSANMSLGAYEVFEATGAIPDPEWPELTFQEILKIAFKDKFIDSMDHVVIRTLLGAV